MDETKISKITTFFEKEYTRLNKDEETLNEVESFQITYKRSLDESFLALLTTENKFRETVELSRKTFVLSNLTKTISIITLGISLITLFVVSYYSWQNYESSKTWQKIQTPILKVIEKILMTPEDNSMQ